MTNLIKTADIKFKILNIDICEEYMSFIPSEPGFPVDFGATFLGFLLFLDFVKQCLSAKVCAVNHWFCGKIRFLKTYSK